MAKPKRVVLGEGHLQILRGSGGGSTSISLWETLNGPESKIKGNYWEGFKVRLVAEILE